MAPEPPDGPTVPVDEERLRLSEERFRLLVQGVTDYGIFMLEPDGRVCSWNEGARRIKGWTAGEIIGQHFSRFYPREAVDRGWPDHELAVARIEGRFEDEGWRIRKDGSRFWANVVITAMRDHSGALLGYSKITRDLTERRNHENALRQSEERFRLLVEVVSDYAIFMLDPEGRVMSWNLGAQRIKGWTAGEIIGQHFSRFYPEDAMARGWPEHELAVARREGRFEDEGWRLRKDGTRFWASVVITALHDDAGTLQGFAKITRDLTERRKVEQLLEEGRNISEFLAMLGHELRNPLTPIRNAAAILQARTTTDAHSVRACKALERQLAHLGRLVDDLLDVGRITSGKVVVKPESLDLCGIVSHAVESMRPMFEAKQQSAESRLPGSPVHVNGDATRLFQVVVNLLSNASKYTPAGGHVWIDLERDGRFAELRVRDDGIGIAPELLPRVFELFTQGDRGLDRDEGGLGIGLTLVKKLIELHGGTVSASSAGSGRGSTLVVRMPLGKAAPAGAGTEQEPHAKAPAGRLRVLVVDDNLDAADTLALLVEEWGHDVRTAPDGEVALAVASDYRPHVVLLDIGLPRMNGYEVARRLSSSALAPYLVALTGYGQAEDRERAREAGFSEHLVKPIDPERLQAFLAARATAA